MISAPRAVLASPSFRTRGRRWDPGWRTVFAASLLYLGYYALAKLSLTLRPTSNPMALVWLPSGVLLSVLLLAPRRQWWFYLTVAVPAHIAAYGPFNVPVSRLVWPIAFNSVVSVLAASGLRRFSKSPLRFDRVREVVVYVFLTASATAVASLTATGVIQELVEVAAGKGAWAGLWMEWRRVFLGNFLAFLLLTPVVLLWADRGAAWVLRVSSRRVVESGLIVVGLVAITIVGFARGANTPAEAPVSLFALFPFLLWAAVRYGPMGESSFMLAVAVTSIWMAVHGHGPFGWTTSLDGLLPLQLFLMISAIPLIFLAAAIAERGAAEARLRVSEERYREVVDSQTDLVCRYRPDTTLTFVNEALCRCFGRKRDELIGQKLVGLIPAGAGERLLGDLASLQNGGAATTDELELVRPDGTVAWQQWMTHAIEGPDGIVAEFQAIGRDITDRKRADEANRNLAHVQRLALVGELTASIAHQINQPLNAILINAEAATMLLESEHPRIDQVRQILVDIRKIDLRASEVVWRVRTLLGKRELEMRPVDLNAASSEVVQLVAGDAQRRRIAVASEYALPLPSVHGDRVHLQQVLLNLLLNGMDAMTDVPESRRKLLVRTARNAEGFVEVAVSDSGHGIAPEGSARLFESFYTTKRQGMGLGLSIARTIIEAHRGRMWVENNAGGGATFRFALPAMTTIP